VVVNRVGAVQLLMQRKAGRKNGTALINNATFWRLRWSASSLLIAMLILVRLVHDSTTPVSSWLRFSTAAVNIYSTLLAVGFC
jgi:anti-sigma-K factor RskA